MSPAHPTPERALAEALARNDLDAVAEIVANHLFALLQNDWRALVEAIERLPDEVVAANPGMGIIRDFGASVRLRDGAINLEVLPALSGNDAAAAGLSDRLLDAVLLQEMLAHRFRADFVAAKAIGARLRARISRPDERGRRPLHDVVAFAALHVGITEVLAGDLEQSLRDFADARILRVEGQHDLSEQDANLKAAAVHAVLGRLGESERLMRRADALPEPGESFAGFLASTRSAIRALIAVDRLDAEAPALTEEAIERNGDDEFWSLALLASTRWSIVTGDLAGALDAVDQATAFRPMPAGSLAAGIAVAARAQALAMLGEFGAARDVLDGGGECTLRDAAVVRVRLALHLDGPQAAIAAARAIAVQPGLGPSARAETMLLAAWAQTLLFGAPEPGTARPLGALVARERLWRMLQLVPAEVVAQIPGLEAAPAFARGLALPEAGSGIRLSPNELEILRLLAGPDPLPAIARARFVTLNTVKTQVASVYRRLGVHGRREAVAEAGRRGLLS